MLAWRFWPWRRDGGTATPAGAPPSRCRRRPGWPPSTVSPPTAPDPAGPALLGQPAPGLAAAPGPAECVTTSGPMRPDRRCPDQSCPPATSRAASGSAPAPWPPATGSRGSWSGRRRPARPPGRRPRPGRLRPGRRHPAPTRPTAASASATTPTKPASSPTPSRARSTPASPGPGALDEDVELVPSSPARPGPLPAPPPGERPPREAVGRGPPRRGGRGRPERRDHAGLVLGRPQGRGPPLVLPDSAPPGPRWPGGRKRAEARSSAPSTPLNGPVLKLTAQLLPVGDGDPGEGPAQLRHPGGGWRQGRGPGRARVRGRLPGDRLGRRRRARLPGRVGDRDRRGAGLRGHGGRRPGGRRRAAGRAARLHHPQLPAAERGQRRARPPGRVGPAGAVHRAQPVLPLRRAGRRPGPAQAAAAGRRGRPVLRAPAHDQGAGPRADPRRAVPLVPVAVGVPRPDPLGPDGGAGRRPRRLPPQPVGQRRRARPWRRLPPGRLHPPGRLSTCSGSRPATTPTPRPGPGGPASGSTTAPSATAGSGSPWSRTASSRTATRTTATRPAGATT